MDSSLINFNSPNSSLSANSHKSMIKDLFSLDSSFDLLGSNYHDYDSHGSEISSDFSPVASPINDPDLLDPTTGFNVPMSADLSSQLDTESSVSSASLTNGAGWPVRSVNYYPNFDPREYFCDTVAVDNASMVAQIVGKKGAKIKHLVAKYGIRIRTPNIDQEPVFVIKGKRADVYRVKQEIMSAAEHFMRIEKNKKEKLNLVMASQNTTSMKLFVPTRFIGLVIGRSGNIVRDLQTTHKVYIETPKFELRQYFRIFGSMDDIIATVSAIKALLVAKSGICFKQQLAATGQDEIHLLE